MTSGEIAFMALAEEKNFTRAAERIFMSQQGLSDHIRRLEEEYGTLLVTRKPKVALTETGTAVYNMLLAKDVMERDIRRMIVNIDQGDIGDVRIGITSSRAGVFAGDIISRFHELHPDVHLSLVTDLTVFLMKMLYDGKLDFVIGVNPPVMKGLRTESVLDDMVCLAVPKHIAEERTGDASIVDIRSYKDVPFIRDLDESSAGNMIDRFLAKNNIALNTIINSNDYNEQAELCSILDAAMFCSKTFIYSPARNSIREKMKILDVRGLDDPMTICLIVSEGRVYPKCVTDMIEVSRYALNSFYERNIASK